MISEKHKQVSISRHLRLHIDCLHLVSSAPIDSLPRDRLVEVIKHQLTYVRNHLLEHFALEEEGGYLAPLLAHRPDLVKRARALEDQHALLKDDLADLIEEVVRCADLTQLYDKVSELIEAFEIHEHMEHQLIALACRDRSGLSQGSLQLRTKTGSDG